MSTQSYHTVIWNKTRYLVVDFNSDNASIYHPSTHGFTPSPICDDCKDGFYCTFHLAGDRLLMTQLNLMTADGKYAPIEGVDPLLCREDHTMMYRRLRFQPHFTGTVRIGCGKVSNVFLPRCTLDPDSILELWDLAFDNGKLVSAYDRMGEIRQQIEMQNQARKFIHTHHLDMVRRRELLALCSYEEQNIPCFDVMQPDKIKDMLAQLQDTLNTPYWFIEKYAESGLSQSLTFDYMRELGIPGEMLAFMRRFVGGAVTEKMVILELIESMYRGIAAPYWEERVAPDYLYTNANIPAEVTSAIRERLAQVSLESWNIQEPDTTAGASHDLH